MKAQHPFERHVEPGEPFDLNDYAFRVAQAAARYNQQSLDQSAAKALAKLTERAKAKEATVQMAVSKGQITDNEAAELAGPVQREPNQLETSIIAALSSGPMKTVDIAALIRVPVPRLSVRLGRMRSRGVLRSSVVIGDDRAKMWSLAAMLLLLAVLTGCVTSTVTPSEPVATVKPITVSRSGGTMPPLPVAVSAAPLPPKPVAAVEPRYALNAAAPYPTATIRLEWDNYTGDAAGFRIYHGTNSGQYHDSYFVLGGDSTKATLSVTPGETYFAATAVLADGTETGLGNEVHAEVYGVFGKLLLKRQIFQMRWEGPAGVLQASPDLNLWSDVQPIAYGFELLVTNDAPQMFYRVRQP